jgi:outer membrane putative beta-barrel porin/alpha-amylase
MCLRRGGLCIRRVVIVLVLLGLPAAWAGPPFITDDPEIPPPNGWEVNVPFILEHSRGETDMETPLFDINYGTPSVWGLPRVQLELDIPVEVVSRNGGSTDAGLGDILLGVKWPFVEEQGWRPLVAIYPQFLLPTGERSRGLGEGRPAYILPVVAEKNWGKWTAYGDVGYVVQTADDQRNYWYGGVSINREITERLELGGEIAENSPPPPEGYSNLAFNLGGTWKLSEQFDLLFSAGRSIHGDTDFMAYLGIQMLLGGTK